MADYVDYKARTFLTQSTNCDDWDAINESLLNLYDDDKLNVVFEDEHTPQFYSKKNWSFQLHSEKGISHIRRSKNHFDVFIKHTSYMQTFFI